MTKPWLRRLLIAGTLTALAVASINIYKEHKEVYNIQHEDTTKVTEEGTYATDVYFFGISNGGITEHGLFTRAFIFSPNGTDFTHDPTHTRVNTIISGRDFDIDGTLDVTKKLEYRMRESKGWYWGPSTELPMSEKEKEEFQAEYSLMF